MLKAITYILENDTDVGNIIGLNKALDKHKVYPVVAPESEVAPYLVCRIVRKQTMGKGCGYYYTVEVTSYHTSYDDVTLLNDSVIDALINQQSGTINGVSFDFATLSSESDAFDKDHSLYAKVTLFDVNGL